MVLLFIVALTALCVNAKTYKGTITIKVGETYSVDVSYGSYVTQSGYWSKSNSTFVFVSQGQRSCTIRGNQVGTGTLEYWGLVNADVVEYYWTVNVQAASVPVNKIELNKTQMTLDVNAQEQLTATVLPSNATNKSVTWSSSSESVATVSSSGNVTAKSAGTAKITCKANDGSGVSASCSVTVNTVAVEPEEISTTIKDVVAGYGYSLIIDMDGSLWSCGDNSSGQLGDGTRENRPFFSKIMNEVISVSAGIDHTLILKKDASLWACGESKNGQLGIDNPPVYKPEPIKVTDNVIATAAGRDFSLIVKKDGSLWACGKNDFGQLGDGSTTDRKSLVKIMDGVAGVAAGDYHTLILKKDATLWTCGKNNDGQLGDGTTDDRYSPVKVFDDVLSVSAGSFHTMVVKKDGSLWTCGLNGNGQLGTHVSWPYINPSFTKIMEDVASVGTTKSSVTQIIKTDGSYWACGYNGADNLGGGQTSGAISTPFKILDGVSAISSGSEFTLLIKKDGSLWACGKNVCGQLGTGTTTDIHTFQQIVKGNDKGMITNPFTPAEANAYGSALAANEQSQEDYYVRGMVVSIKEQFGTQYGNATFYISADGTEKDQFYIYRALYLENTKYAGQDLQLRVGDDVVVCGKITNYLGTLPETVQNQAYVVAINGTTSGIREITADGKADAPVYNLAGQKVTTVKKGVYIVGGKKVVVK